MWISGKGGEGKACCRGKREKKSGPSVDFVETCSWKFYTWRIISVILLFLWKHVDECLRLEDSFESQSATRARLLFCGNMFMNVWNLRNHLNFRKRRRGQGLLLRKEGVREEIRSKCWICGNMFMNNLDLKNRVSHFVVAVETCWWMFETWGFIWIAVWDLRTHLNCRQRRGQDCCFCGNMFMNVWNLRNHLNFRKRRRGQGLLPRKERVREEIRSKCWFCGNMFMNF